MTAVSGPDREVVHACPPGDTGFTPCCDRTPFELDPRSRMTADPALVTCGAVSGPDRAWLDQLDALRQAGTEGPWRWDPEFAQVYETGTGLALTNDAGDEIVGAYNYHCCDFRDDPRVGDTDAALIVAAVNALPSLLAAARERDALRAAVERLAEEWLMAAELYDAAALDGRISGNLMAEGGHLIQAGDARRFAGRLRAVVAGTTGEADCGCGGTGIRKFDSDGYEACPIHLGGLLRKDNDR